MSPGAFSQGPVPPTPAPPFCGECHGAKTVSEMNEGTVVHQVSTEIEERDRSKPLHGVEDVSVANPEQAIPPAPHPVR